MEQQWISVKDELPENTNNVIVFSGSIHNQNCAIEIAFFDEQWKGAPTYFTDGITHWMPLPEPPNI